MNALMKWTYREPAARWNPFKEMEDLQNQLSSLFNLTSARKSSETEESVTMSHWAPLVNIAEEEKQYVIETELPEMKKDEIQVTVENDVLTIAGERKLEKEEKGRKYHRVERAYGKFSRSFSLPDDADATKIQADFKDGILRVRVQKNANSKPKTIDIKVA